ncbi:hypothetical protein KAX29_01760 [candidate division WOR-3 bacterium]|nr:hypothetical protein [candidate division WOR-3 bacterium]
MILLFLSFWGSFAWHPISEIDIGKNTYETILNSHEGRSVIMQYGGERNLVKGSISLGASIFKGGEMVLLPKGCQIRRVPENLLLMKRAIKMKKYDRYGASYKEGRLKEEWQELETESAYELGVSSLEAISPERLNEYFPDLVSPSREEMEKVKKEGSENVEMRPEEEKEREISYPEKNYFSFLLIEENGRERLIPVILRLSPIEELMEEFVTEKEEGGER